MYTLSSLKRACVVVVFDNAPLSAGVSQLHSRVGLSCYWIAPISSGSKSDTTSTYVVATLVNVCDYTCRLFIYDSSYVCITFHLVMCNTHVHSMYSFNEMLNVQNNLIVNSIRVTAYKWHVYFCGRSIRMQHNGKILLHPSSSEVRAELPSLRPETRNRV